MTGGWDLPEIVAPIARAVQTDRVTALAQVLAAFGAAGAFANDAYFARPSDCRYQRFPLWRDPAGRFVIVSMTWSPGQGTPIHDHAGRWGAELVVRGTMCETSYHITERSRDGRARLAAQSSAPRRANEISVIMPSVDVHALRNVGSGVAHTVHVYSGRDDACTTFTRDDEQWWSAERIELAYDV